MIQQKAGICIDLEGEREGGLETAVLWRGTAEPAWLFRGGLSENVSFFPPHLLFNDSTAAAVVMLCLFLSSLLTIRCLAETISLWSAYLRRAVDSDKVLNCCHFSTLGWLDGLHC